MRNFHQKRPRLKLPSTEYRALRNQVLKRDSWRCQFCGTSNNLTRPPREIAQHAWRRPVTKSNYSLVRSATNNCTAALNSFTTIGPKRHSEPPGSTSALSLVAGLIAAFLGPLSRPFVLPTDLRLPRCAKHSVHFPLHDSRHAHFKKKQAHDRLPTGTFLITSLPA